MKKKLFFCLLLCLTLCLTVGTSAFAEEAFPNIIDNAGIMDSAAVAELCGIAQEVSERYGCGVYAVIVDDFSEYVNGDIQYFSESVYQTYGLGMGEGRNGIILSLSMAERDYDLAAYGDSANYAFTDYGKDALADSFLDNFRSDDWAGGVRDYITNAAWLLEQAAAGEPYDTVVYDDYTYEPVPVRRGITPIEGFVIIFLPCMIALAVCSIFKAKMKTARLKTQAQNYVESGVKLTVSNDRFLHSTETRQLIPRNTGSRGGGHSGGTTVNSGGFSHKSGKF